MIGVCTCLVLHLSNEPAIIGIFPIRIVPLMHDEIALHLRHQRLLNQRLGQVFQNALCKSCHALRHPRNCFRRDLIAVAPVDGSIVTTIQPDIGISKGLGLIAKTYRDGHVFGRAVLPSAVGIVVGDGARQQRPAQKHAKRFFGMNVHADRNESAVAERCAPILNRKGRLGVFGHSGDIGCNQPKRDIIDAQIRKQRCDFLDQFMRHELGARHHLNFGSRIRFVNVQVWQLRHLPAVDNCWRI